MNREAEARDVAHVTALFTTWMAERVWHAAGSIRLGGQDYRQADDAEFAGLGYPTGDDDTVLVRRESDGAFFELKIGLLAVHIRPGGHDIPADIPGQMAIDEVLA